MNYDPPTSGERVMRLRERRRMSQSDVANKAGLSRGYISEFERGERENVRLPTLNAIAVALGWPDWHTLMASDALDPPEPRDIDGRLARLESLLVLGAGTSVQSAQAQASRGLVAPPPVAVPIVAQASAGSGSGAIAEDYVYVHPEQASGRILKAVRVQGECLLPTLKPDDVVVLDCTPGVQPRPDQIVAATLTHEGPPEGVYVFKRWGGYDNGYVVLKRDDGQPAVRVPRRDFHLEGVYYLLVTDRDPRTEREM